MKSAALYGVYGNCTFDALHSFDVKCLPWDVMHDLLEWVLPLVMKSVICKARHQKHTMWIQRQAKKFNHQEEWQTKQNVVRSSCQKWCLCRLSPFLMADCVPPDSPHWHMFLLCSEIVAIVMATKARKDLAHFRLPIQEFLSKTVEVMANVSTPKCHYLIHNPKTNPNLVAWPSPPSMLHEARKLAPIYQKHCQQI